MLKRLKPRFFEKVWGSEHLGPWFASRGEKTGEIWFDSPASMPLLVKFIFTSEKLSVQVHPDDQYAALHHNCCGKTEMWYILAAQPGARIAAGFREPLSRKRMREAAHSGEITDLLEWHPAAPGDTFFIPARTVHAIGEGLVLCEIQQASDITYRIYDYGRPRELHLDHAVAVSKRGRHNARPRPRGKRLVSCDYFTTERHVIQGRAQLDAPRLLVILEGQGRIERRPARAVEVWHAAPQDSPVNIEGDLTLLAVSAPER